MNHSRTSRLAVALALFAASLGATAGNVTVSLGSGPQGFDSRGLDVAFNPTASLGLNAGHFVASSNGTTSMQQTTAGIDWQVSEKVSVNLGATRIDDDIFIMEGGDLGVSLPLNHYWKGERTTLLNLGYGRMDYTPDTARNLPASFLEHLPEQERFGIGLVQGLSEQLTLNLSYDRYDYSTDPTALARAVAIAFIKRGRYPPNSAFTLIAFPDNSYSIGLGWETGRDIGVDFGFSETETVLGQKLRNTSLGVTYYGQQLTVGMSISRSFSTDAKTANGFTVIPSGDDVYVDFRVGINF